MSVELRWVVEGECNCSVPRLSTEPATCRHHVECDWGRFTNADLSPHPPIHYLMIAHTSWVSYVKKNGPTIAPRYVDESEGGIVSVTSENDRTFFHLDHNGQRWTWELFPAHFADRYPSGLLVGRWPD